MAVSFKPRLDLGDTELGPPGDMPVRQPVLHTALNPPHAASKVARDAALIGPRLERPEGGCAAVPLCRGWLHGKTRPMRSANAPDNFEGNWSAALC
jgi:hypothetical protein